MFDFLKNHMYSIGVDIGDDTLKLIQLGTNGKNESIKLIAGGSSNRPADVKAGSSSWQRWAITAIHQLMENGKFHGRDVIAAMPAGEVFIDHIRMPKTNNNTQEQILAKIKHKLPFEPEETMIKYIPTEDDNALVIATERKKIDRHLAIYEQANLQIKSIGVWPAAMANAYTRFFGRRKSDIEAIVMLLDIEPGRTNVVICRHKNLLFARSISTGTKQLDTEEMITRLVLELTACRRQFASMYRNAQIERLIFLSGSSVNKNICTTIAKQLEIPAQLGDCLVAVEITNSCDAGLDRRGSQVNWATAFGLSLS